MTVRNALHLPEYIPLRTAAKLTGFTAPVLQEMIVGGKILAINLNGEIVVSKRSALQAARRSLKKEDLPEYKQFAHLKGCSIGINEAANKYDVAFSTLRRWSERGYIRRVGNEKNKILLHEQDGAYCVFIYSQNKGQGKHIFNPDGTPFTPKRMQTEAA